MYRILYNMSMAEEMKSVSQARAALPSLSKEAFISMKRFIITQRGEPQAVIIGYPEYRSFLAGMRLFQEPKAVPALDERLARASEESIPATDLHDSLAAEAVEREIVQKIIPRTGADFDLADVLSEATSLKRESVEKLLQAIRELPAQGR
jgi:PHD/YefM family antitoxin component YafN of YafNO toxin-antitoxin module